MNNAKIKPIIWVLLTAFLVRFILAIFALIQAKSLRIFHVGDTASYLKPAHDLLTYGRFTSNGFPEIFRVPGYCIMLIPGIILNQVELVTVALQIGLTCLAVYLVYKIALLLFNNNEPIAVICAFLYALEPLSIIYTVKLLTESAFACLILAFLYCFLKYFKGQSLSWLLVSSIILAISTYVRPIAYYLPFLLTLLLVIWELTKTPHKIIALFHALLFFSLSMGPIYLWNIRNKTVADYSGFSSVVEVNLYYWHAAALLTVKEGKTFGEQQIRLQNQLKNEVPKEAFRGDIPAHLCCTPAYTSPTVLNYMRTEAKKIIFKNYLIYFKLRLNGTLNLLLNSTPWPYLTTLNVYKIDGFADIANQQATEFIKKGLLAGMAYYLNQTPGVVSRTWLILQVNLILYMVFALIGLLSKNFFKPFPSLIVMTLGFYLTIIPGGPDALSSRYRHPIMPIICILAGYGVYFIVVQFKQRFMANTK
ncbi:MAG TPA: hypothetical protein DCY88_14825 [Cyanobacteria bacterium UBA11372]|nr:hypothetical protein [Cyanobacteria bacterium UBA11372]